MSNLNSLKKSDLIALVQQLERNAEDDRRRIGVMMYEANQLQHRVNELESEVEDLSSQLSDINEDKLNDTIESQRDIIKVQAERIKLLSHKVAAQPKIAPPASQPNRPAPKPAPKPLPSPAVEMAPVISITDADKAIWSKFQRLSREERMTIINWARPQFGHIGIHNIIAVRQAWHEFNNPVSCADEANLADIA